MQRCVSLFSLTFIALLATYVTTIAGAGQHQRVVDCRGLIDGANARCIEVDDKIIPLLSEFEDRIRQNYIRHGNLIIPRFGEWLEIESKAAEQVFPDLRFVSITRDENKNPEAEQKLIGLAICLDVTLAIDTNHNTIVAKLPGSGNYEPFGELLKQRNIILCDEADVRRLWEVFCDIHCRRLYDQPHEKTGDHEWRLGQSSHDQTRSNVEGVKTIITRKYYILVRTDPASDCILSWKLQSEQCCERTIPDDDQADESAP